jgi:hypothetical protein
MSSRQIRIERGAGAMKGQRHASCTTGTFPNPDTNLVQGSDGNLYGATFYGGAYDLSYFFKLVLN